MQQIKSVQEQLKLFKPLLSNIIKKYLKENVTYKFSQEENLAIDALVITSEINKLCELSWYITICVRNRIVDVNTSNKIPSINNRNSLDADSDMELELDRVTTFNPYNNVEFDSVCRRILTKEEYAFYKNYFSYGFAFEEIQINKESNIPMLRSDKKLQGDLEKCLLLIYQKLKLKEQNQIFPT
jgi:hypothetical protein